MMQKKQARPLKSAGDRRRRKLSESDIFRMQLPKNFWNAKEEGIKPENSDHKKYILKYVNNINKMYEENVGLGLWGKNGSGKTAMLSIVLKEARRWGYTALFVRAEQIRSAEIDGTKFESKISLIDRARTVDFLGIDDLGKEHRGESAYSVNLIHSIFRSRSDDRLPTIFTTNFAVTGQKFLDIYKSSLIEILRECCQLILVDGHDYRNEREDHIANLFAN